MTPLKKDVKAMFLAVRHGDLAQVHALAAAMPELVDAVASPPPKKDHGQSALQVALKCGQMEEEEGRAIIAMLLAAGADPDAKPVGGTFAPGTSGHDMTPRELARFLRAERLLP